MTGGSGAAAWSGTSPGWRPSSALRSVPDDRPDAAPGPDRSQTAAEYSSHAGETAKSVPAGQAAASAIAARTGLAAVPTCPGDAMLPGRGLGRRTGHQQHRAWAAALAVRTRRRRPAVARARLLVDPAKRKSVGVRPGRLPGC